MTLWVWGLASSSFISCRVFRVGGLIHQAVEFALVSDLQFEKPRLAGGVGIDQRGLGRQGVIDLKYFAGDRRVDIGGGLDGFDHRGGFRLLQAAADLRQLDEYDVAELRLRIVGYPDGGDVALDTEPFVVGCEQRGHENSFSVYR